MWILRATMWILRATMWIRRAVMWILRAVMWILRARSNPVIRAPHCRAHTLPSNKPVYSLGNWTQGEKRGRGAM
eukprot:8228764-Pyramimonas_sp.AAC.1